MTAEPLPPVDPFDLPDWLGTAEVCWTAEGAVREGHRVAGLLATAGGESLPCDLLAVDEAYPLPVADDAARTAAHQAWRHGQVHLVAPGGRLVLAVPGRRFAAEDALDAVERLALAVGAHPERWTVRLRLGTGRGRH